MKQHNIPLFILGIIVGGLGVYYGKPLFTDFITGKITAHFEDQIERAQQNGVAGEATHEEEPNTAQNIENDSIKELANGDVKLAITGEWPGQKLVLNGDTVIRDNDMVAFIRAYPDVQNPEIIIAVDDCSGSACGNGPATLIDLKATPPFYATIPYMGIYGLELKKNDDDANTYILAGYSNHLTNDLGDTLPVSFTYDRAARKISLQTKNGHLYKGLEYAYNILSDEKARAIFLEKMDAATFKRWREAMDVSTPVEWFSFDRFVVGQGMQAHSGGNPSAFFIIDLLYDKFYGAYYKDGRLTSYGDLKESDLRLFHRDVLKAAGSQFGIDTEYSNEGDIYAPDEK